MAHGDNGVVLRGKHNGRETQWAGNQLGGKPNGREASPLEPSPDHPRTISVTASRRASSVGRDHSSASVGSAPSPPAAPPDPACFAAESRLMAAVAVRHGGGGRRLAVGGAAR